MFREYLLACVGGLGCGVANALYLLLVLYAASAVRGIRRTLLVFSWPVHVGASALLVIGVAGRFVPHGGPAVDWFLFSWLPLPVGAVIWYLRTHPNPAKLLRPNEPKG